MNNIINFKAAKKQIQRNICAQNTKSIFNVLDEADEYSHLLTANLEECFFDLFAFKTSLTTKEKNQTLKEYEKSKSTLFRNIYLIKDRIAKLEADAHKVEIIKGQL